MSINISWDVKGLDQLDKALSEIGTAAGAKVLRKAGREAMGDVAFVMAMGAGVDASSDGEHMRDDIKISTKIADSKKGGKDNAAVIRVGPSKKHAQKAIAQEYGTANQTADPFMRPALYENRERVVNTFTSELMKGINKAKKKAARQAK